MGYASLQACVAISAQRPAARNDVPSTRTWSGGKIHRRVYQAGGPAVCSRRVVDCAFPMCATCSLKERMRVSLRTHWETVAIS